ncbi:DUF1932 domain-containing protein [Chloroflexota bacterium]
MLPENPRLGVIGFGEAGYYMSKGLKEAGFGQIVAYNNGRRNKPPYTEAFKQKAQSIDVKLTTTLKELIENTDLIFSTVIPQASVEVTREAAPFLAPSHLYVDLNSCSPEAKREGWGILKERGVCYVDGVIGVGNPIQDENRSPIPSTGEGAKESRATISKYEHRSPICAAGEGAEEFHDTMSKYGMNIYAVSGKVGDAALLKMIISTLAKGIDSLLWESFQALHKAGLDPKIYASHWASRAGLFDGADHMISRTAIHARRRAGEMEFSADTLRSLGVEPIMAEATAKHLAWCAGLNLQDYFPEGQPSTYKAVFEILDRIKQEGKA